ncbi:MAG: hypothetical protein ACI4AM_03040 [Muribaculaceae bacterium]
MNVSKGEFQLMVELTTADLVVMLIKEHNLSMEQAMDVVYNSDTYRTLNMPESNFYFQSPGYVYDFLNNEIKTGRMA